ncbi:unnamed protein product [Lampetra fluviatilis]
MSARRARTSVDRTPSGIGARVVQIAEERRGHRAGKEPGWSDEYRLQSRSGAGRGGSLHRGTHASGAAPRQWRSGTNERECGAVATAGSVTARRR